MPIIKIEERFSDATLNIALDTLAINKQALIFVNSKRAAESVAEKISVKVKNIILEDLSIEAKKVLSRPTKQCERLSRCVKRGIAFHHAGLAAKQRELIEENFRKGKIKIICSTPTLASGLDMPAFRTVIRDLKRYSGRWGMEWIQVLEYHQMAGRAGRPGHENFGEALCIAQTNDEKKNIIEKFINGKPEEIYSKLAVEPVLRTYVLSLIAGGFLRSRDGLMDFFSETFWAHQYQDMDKLAMILDKVIMHLIEWKFLDDNNDSDDLKSASIYQNFTATRLGKRVAELYIDPFTANFMITCLKRAKNILADEFSYIHMACSTFEIRPIFRIRVKEYDFIEQKIAEYEDRFICLSPSIFDNDYQEFLNTIKTAIVLNDWINETSESDILEKYNVRPGELKLKLDTIEWLLNAAIEFCRILGYNKLTNIITKSKIRLKYGVKKELLPLLKLKNIGRVRARIMYRNGIKNLGDVKKSDQIKLAQLIGPAIAKDIKKQVGIDADKIIVKPNKRKGQKSLEDY